MRRMLNERLHFLIYAYLGTDDRESWRITLPELYYFSPIGKSPDPGWNRDLKVKRTYQH